MVVDKLVSPGGRWGDHNAERRRVIMDALIELIEEFEPGSEIPLQAIADRAGVKRSVIYRHFVDRRELDARTRQYAVELHLDEVTPTLDPDDTLRETIFRTVDGYVRLVSARPRLNEWVERGPGSQDPSGQAVVSGTKAAIAERISVLFETAAAVLGQTDPGIEVAAFAIVSMVDGAVTRWLHTRPDGYGATAVSRLLTDSIVYLVQGHARVRDIEVDPDIPVGELLTRASAAL
ncbi:TetR/AcrR family transcriptional regulator [Nocardia acidivorans]|uniref:TetR/AcrR family transcriptional regulator n=1 Tax=Nocardia acidivorans TaxID=404580 RepID=UPI000830EA1F|nr:TetR/AcrR family transcriptional regulator [Nocardia acidivorans]